MSRLDKISRQREERGRQRIEQEAWELEHYGETERQGLEEAYVETFGYSRAVYSHVIDPSTEERRSRIGEL
jgi:hypothetical protein